MAERSTKVDKDQDIDGGIDISQADIDAEMAVQSWLEELGGAEDARIMVYRAQAKSKRMTFIDSFEATEIDPDQLLHKLRFEYGGGTFRVQMRANGRIQKSQTIDVEPPLKNDAMPGGPFGNVNWAEILRELKSTTEKEDNTGIILQFMQESNKQFQSMLMTMLQGMNAQKSEGMDMKDVISIFGQLQAMTGANNKTDPVEMLLKGMEFAREFGGDHEPNMYDVFNKAMGTFGSTLNEAMKNGAPMPQLPAPQTHARIQHQNNQQKPTQEKQEQKPAQETAPQGLPANHPLKAYESYIQWLVDCARRNLDPETYANVVIDQIGDEQARQIFCNPTVIQQVVQSFPAVAEQQAWFTEFLSCVDEFTTGDHTPGNADQSTQSTDTESAVTRGTLPSSDAANGDQRGAGGDSANVTVDESPSINGETQSTDT